MGAGQDGCEKVDWPYLNNVRGLNCRRAFYSIGGRTSVNIDLIDNPVVVDMKLSPDGQHIGLLAPVDGRNILTIIQTSTRTPINLSNLSLIARSAIFIGQITSDC